MKNRKKKENGNLGKTGPFTVAKGTLAVVKSFATAKGCLKVTRPRAKNPPLPLGSPRRSPATPRRSALQ